LFEYPFPHYDVISIGEVVSNGVELDLSLLGLRVVAVGAIRLQKGGDVFLENLNISSEWAQLC
jgi:hypothetical protein